jgi:hypothetical protein
MRRLALQSVLHDFVMLFESHYLGQIERYYHERSRDTSSHPTSSSPTCSARPTRTIHRSELSKHKRRPHHHRAAFPFGDEPLQAIALRDHRSIKSGDHTFGWGDEVLLNTDEIGDSWLHNSSKKGSAPPVGQLAADVNDAK